MLGAPVFVFRFEYKCLGTDTSHLHNHAVARLSASNEAINSNWMRPEPSYQN